MYVSGSRTVDLHPCASEFGHENIVGLIDRRCSRSTHPGSSDRTQVRKTACARRAKTSHLAPYVVDVLDNSIAVL